MCSLFSKITSECSDSLYLLHHRIAPWSSGAYSTTTTLHKHFTSLTTLLFLEVWFRTQWTYSSTICSTSYCRLWFGVSCWNLILFLCNQSFQTPKGKSTFHIKDMFIVGSLLQLFTRSHSTRLDPKKDLILNWEPNCGLEIVN